MRAARLLHILLLLQNRSRLTSKELAQELEVTPRTILRDVDAMTEAGLPIIVHQGNRGGIELGFDYRTKLTGLSESEAEALGIILSTPVPELSLLELERDGKIAISKLLHSFPDKIRERAEKGREMFRCNRQTNCLDDIRVSAMAGAIRNSNIVIIRTKTKAPRTIHPTKLQFDADSCCVEDSIRGGEQIKLENWGDINISRKQYKKI